MRPRARVRDAADRSDSERHREHGPPASSCSFGRSEKVARRFCFRPPRRRGWREGGSRGGGFFKIVGVPRQLHHQRPIAAAAAAVLRQQVVAAPAKAPFPRRPPRCDRSRARATAPFFISSRPVVFSFLLVPCTNLTLSLLSFLIFFYRLFPNPRILRTGICFTREPQILVNIEYSLACSRN